MCSAIVRLPSANTGGSFRSDYLADGSILAARPLLDVASALDLLPLQSVGNLL
jgi:hypothetical protein